MPPDPLSDREIIVAKKPLDHFEIARQATHEAMRVCGISNGDGLYYVILGAITRAQSLRSDQSGQQPSVAEKMAEAHGHGQESVLADMSDFDDVQMEVLCQEIGRAPMGNGDRIYQHLGPIDIKNLALQLTEGGSFRKAFDATTRPSAPLPSPPEPTPVKEADRLEPVYLYRFHGSGSYERATEAEKVIEAARDLLRFAERNQCAHEETHRGGAIWTICDACGKKWADDEGGFKPHQEPSEIAALRDALSSLTRRHGGGQ